MLLVITKCEIFPKTRKNYVGFPEFLAKFTNITNIKCGSDGMPYPPPPQLIK